MRSLKIPIVVLLVALVSLINGTVVAQAYIPVPHGVKVTVDSLDIDVLFYSDDIVRIVKYPKGAELKKSSFAVTLKPEKVSLRIQEKADVLEVGDSSVMVRLDLGTGQISFLNPESREVLKEIAGGALFSPCKDSLEHGYAVKQTFKLSPDEAIYGLGQHQSGELNKRGRTILLKQANRQIAIPYFYSTAGYGLFWDNTSATVFQDDGSGTSFSSEVGDGIDYYFLKSSSAAEGLREWRHLTGEAPMLPRWAFGYWQSRERYRSQAQLLGVVRKYRALQVPLDVIVQDWQYWGADNRQWNSTEFGNPGYPDPGGMVDSVHDLHAHIMISVWPDFGEKTAVYKAMAEKGYLFQHLISYPPTPAIKVYDPFNRGARDLYWSFISKNLFSIGIDGWWLDSSEPDQQAHQHDDDNMTARGLFGQVRNAFPIETVGGVYTHQRRETSKKRVVILTRSAYAGQQRYGAINWSGDTESSWQTLHAQIANGLSMSVSGIPYWNSDIGGFFSHGHYPEGVSDPAYRELYVRWLEFGAFCPIMRSHGTETPREIYQFGKKGDWSYDAIEKSIDLRYRLLPYLYSVAWQVTSDASTFMCPLEMDFPSDKRTWDISGEYLFGHDLMVCPVTSPFFTHKSSDSTKTRTDFSRKASWPVYLPAGTSWYDFWTGAIFRGGRDVQSPAPIDQIPLYVKAGSIIPLGPVVQYANERKDSVLELRVYPGRDGSFTLYEDGRDGYGYEKGQYSTIRFDWNDRTRVLTVEARKGNFPGMLSGREFKVVLAGEGHGRGIAPAAKPDKLVHYLGQKISVRL